MDEHLPKNKIKRKRGRRRLSELSESVQKEKNDIRKEKNKEKMKRYRNRIKAHKETLEQQNEALQSTVDQLKKQVEDLLAENLQLKFKVATFESNHMPFTFVSYFNYITRTGASTHLINLPLRKLKVSKALPQ